MAKNKKQKKAPRIGEQKRPDTPGLLNWRQVIIQVVFFGGLMFFIQQFYASSGTHEVTKYNYTILQNSATEEIIKVTVYRLGKTFSKPVLFGLHLNNPQEHKLVASSIFKCEADCISAIFGSRTQCVDLSATYNKQSSAASQREFHLQELSADSLYDLEFRVEVTPGTSTAAKFGFVVVDRSALLLSDITNQRQALRLKDYLYLCRLEFLLIALCLLLVAVVLTYRFRIQRRTS